MERPRKFFVFFKDTCSFMHVFSVCALCVCLRASVLSSHGVHPGDPTCVFKLGSKCLYPRTVSSFYLGALFSPRSSAYPREWGVSEHPSPKICGRNRIPGPCPTPARLTQSFTVRKGGTESRHVAPRLQVFGIHLLSGAPFLKAERRVLLRGSPV